MSVRLPAAALAAALVIGAMALGGCGSVRQTREPDLLTVETAVEATTAEPVATEPTATQPAEAGEAAAEAKAEDDGVGAEDAPSKSGLDASALDKQLEAMQSELDGLAMPSDSDFNDAAGAVY